MESLPAIQSNEFEVKSEQLLRLAIEKGVSVETLERLLAMNEQIRLQHAKQAFDRDMAAFQAACPIIKKNRGMYNKGHLNYKYASIDYIVSQVKGLLGQYNFSYTIKTEFVDAEHVQAICIAQHTLGHTESSTFPVPLGTRTAIMSNTQQVAAAFTFAKRYAFCNVFGIMTGEDDTDSVVHVEPVSDELMAELRSLLQQGNYSEATMLAKYKLNSLEDMSLALATTILDALKTSLAKKDSQ